MPDRPAQPANQPPGGWPSLGSVLSKLKGPVDPAVPPFVGLCAEDGTHALGRHGPARLPGRGPCSVQARRREGQDDMVLNGVTLDRLGDRRACSAGFDRFRREADASGVMDGIDAFNQQAFGVLTSSRLIEALDIDKEDPALRERYGHGDPKNRDDGGPQLMDHFLIARRLVEAGARCVTLAFSRWDWHGQTFAAGRAGHADARSGPDRPGRRSARARDWRRTSRSSSGANSAARRKINKDAGRDHWPNVILRLLAGGGMRTGQVIGSTDRLGGEAKDRPVHFQEVFATLYHALGHRRQPHHCRRPERPPAIPGRSARAEVRSRS